MRRFLFVFLLLAPWFSAAETLTGTACDASSSTGCVIRSVTGYHSVAVSLAGTWTGSVVFEVAPFSAGPFHATRAYQLDGTGAYATAATENGAWTAVTGGFPYFRVRASALSSGSVVVTAQASNYVVPADIVRAVGSTFGEVAVSGTVNAALTQESISAIGPSACEHGGVRRLALGSTPEPVPNDLPDGGSGALSGRTMITLQNIDGTHDVACRFDPGDGGVPDCSVPGYGLTVFPRARYVELPARDSDRLLCVACTGSNIPLEYLERSCER